MKAILNVDGSCAVRFSYRCPLCMSELRPEDGVLVHPVPMLGYIHRASCKNDGKAYRYPVHTVKLKEAVSGK